MGPINVLKGLNKGNRFLLLMKDEVTDISLYMFRQLGHFFWFNISKNTRLSRSCERPTVPPPCRRAYFIQHNLTFQLRVLRYDWTIVVFSLFLLGKTLAPRCTKQAFCCSHLITKHTGSRKQVRHNLNEIKEDKTNNDTWSECWFPQKTPQPTPPNPK